MIDNLIDTVVRELNTVELMLSNVRSDKSFDTAHLSSFTNMYTVYEIIRDFVIIATTKKTN